MKRRPGLTLVELLVVLAILAVMTTVAMTLTDSVVDQGRYDATRRTIESVENAILGPANQTDADGSRLISGFVADVGRLPVAVGSDPRTQLQELWLPGTLKPYQAWIPAEDADVKLLAGWRGPYLQLPPATPDLRDAWGEAFILLNAASEPLANGEAPAAIQAKAESGNVYRPGLTSTRLLTAYAAQVSGAVVDVDPTKSDDPSKDSEAKGDVTVRLYHAANGIRTRTVNATKASGYAFSFPSALDPDPVPMGSVALRAYQTTTVTDADGNPVTYTAKSDILYLRVPPGGLNRNIALDIK
jgi:prepilin-type N-terminal cleavage/methylation domain-containing protein